MSHVPESIITVFGLDASFITPLGNGLINTTFKAARNGEPVVLQSINTAVFKYPERIDTNLRNIKTYLSEHHPEYIFPAPLPSSDGRTMVADENGTPWRILPFVPNSESHDAAPTALHAENAARGFAKLTRLLNDASLDLFEDAFPQFHDLTLREEQLKDALQNAHVSRPQKAHDVIVAYKDFSYIGERYREMIETGTLKKRIQHHDTKFNNILFETGTPNICAVIDLDLIMPGYFLSDIGDLIQFGTSVSEEETDLERVEVKGEYYDALIRGYTDELRSALSDEEVALIPFGGLFMTYMLGIRFLADYLNGEVYFKTKYEGQNLDKAKNRLKLLQELAKRGTQ